MIQKTLVRTSLLLAVAAASLTAPASAHDRRGSDPNPVLKCLGADCNDVTPIRSKRRGPRLPACAVETYTAAGDETFTIVDPRYCAG